MCVIEDKTAVVVVVASYRSVSRNPVRVKALAFAYIILSGVVFTIDRYTGVQRSLVSSS